MAEEPLTIEITTQEENPIHKHTGTDTPKIAFKNLSGLIEVVDTVPTSAPNNLYNQIKLYVSGVESSICIYDYNGKSWKYFG